MSKYRELDAINYSRLSNLDEGPWKLLQDISGSKAFSLGTGVDVLLFDGQKELDKQCIVTTLEEPTATLKILMDYCYKNNLNQEWLIEEYVNVLKDDGKYVLWSTTKDLEIRKNKWNTVYFWKYLEFLRESKDKTKLIGDDMFKIKEAVQHLKFSDFTKRIFEDKRGLSQVELVHKIDGQLFKGKLDWIIKDDDEKIIYPFDLKTTSKSLKAWKLGVLKYRYDIQSSLYKHLLELEFPDYQIADFKMVVYSFVSKNANIFNLRNYYEKAKEGYIHKEQYVKGWLQLADELVWHNENQLFEHEKQTYLNNGNIIL